MKTTRTTTDVAPGLPAGGRKAWVAMIVFAAGIMTAVALWSAGFPPEGWLRRNAVPSVGPSPMRADSKPVVAPVAALPNADVSAAFPGIDSSVSKEARALVLTGTILNNGPQETVAFIGVDTRNPQTYGLGALLANGARLRQIAKNYVVLEKNGKTARLYIQNTKVQQAAGSELLTVGPKQSFKHALATYDEIFTQFIRPNAVYEGALLKGYEVYAGRSSGVFAQLGLQPGDVIVAFDGAPLDDPETAMHLMEQLTTGVVLEATVKRKGKTETLALDGSVITRELERVKARPSPVAAAGPIT